MTAPKTPKVPTFRITDTLVLPAGNYVLQGSRRISTALISIDGDGNLSYTNRNGITEPITLTRFATLHMQGYSTPAESAAVPSKVTRAPLA